MTRWQAFLTGVLPLGVLFSFGMAMMLGWQGTAALTASAGAGFPGLLNGIVRCIAFSLYPVIGLGAMIWAHEDARRMSLLYLVWGIVMLTGACFRNPVDWMAARLGWRSSVSLSARALETRESRIASSSG